MATQRNIEKSQFRRKIRWLKEDKKFENNLGKQLLKLWDEHLKSHGGVVSDDCEFCRLYKENVELCKIKQVEIGKEIQKTLRYGS